MALLSLHGVELRFGGLPVLDGVGLNLEEGDRYCLIGRNGEGKTSLMRVVAREIAPDAGEVGYRNGLRVGTVPQDIPAGLAGTVARIVAEGLGAAAALVAEYQDLSARLGAAGGADQAAALKRLEALHAELDRRNAWRLEELVAQVMSRLSLDGSADFASLSGGTRRRVLLARALVGEPELLLLDEPTNHLDIDTIVWLEQFLLDRKGALVFVTHDRAFARRVANRVGEIDRGALYSFDCGYDEFLARRAELLAAERGAAAVFDKKLAQEEAWLRRGVKARRTRDEGRVKALMGMRQAVRERRSQSGGARLRLDEAARSGDLVLGAEGLRFSRGGRVVIRDCSLDVQRGDRVGVIGPNGCGKTTLLRLLLGELQPDAGTVRRGSGVEVIYFDQLRAGLDPQATLFDSIAGGDDSVVVGGASRHVNAYLADFLFPAERGRTKVGSLSGGERNRLLLAKLFLRPGNLLVFDEPTNDLDAETVELLEDLLAAYRGTVLLVSHDRDFLDGVATATLSIEPDGSVAAYAGGYSDWLRQRPKPAAPAAKPAPPAAKPRREEAARKRSYREAQELAALPDAIAALEAEQAALHARQADPELYRSGGGEAAKLGARLAELESALAAAYARWEELESLPS